MYSSWLINFNLYVCRSYSPQSLRFFDGKEHPGKQPDAMAIIPITLICQCLTMPFGPIFNQKLGASKTILVGSLVVALGVIKFINIVVKK
jgi:hypothetical protein